MAQIKMDISEYEALKKVESLLEESKAKQEKLYQELDKIQKEKIQVLNESAYQVVIKKIIVHRHIRLATVKENLFDIFLKKMYDFVKYYQGNFVAASLPYKEELSKAFFHILEDSEMTELVEEQEEVVSYKGLQQVTEELKEQITTKIESQIDVKYKRALEFEKANKGLAKLHLKNETEVIPKLLSQIEELTKEVKVKEEKIEDLSLVLQKKKNLLSKIEENLSKVTFFNKGKIFSKIKNYIKDDTSSIR